MDSEIRSLRIRIYTGQLAVCDKVRANLSKELENGNLTRDERIAIVRRWDAARKETRDLQFTLEMLERQDRDAKIGPSPTFHLSSERRRA
jgi:hypothetical protein